jgi:hypothetical protein
MIDHCEACGRECSTGESCLFPKIQFSDGKTVERLRYVGESALTPAFTISTARTKSARAAN